MIQYFTIFPKKVWQFANNKEKEAMEWYDPILYVRKRTLRFKSWRMQRGITLLCFQRNHGISQLKNKAVESRSLYSERKKKTIQTGEMRIHITFTMKYNSIIQRKGSYGVMWPPPIWREKQNSEFQIYGEINVKLYFTRIHGDSQIIKHSYLWRSVKVYVLKRHYI